MTGHAGFIAAAYAVAALVLGGAAVLVVLDGRSLRRALARFERPEGGGDDDRR